MLTLAEAAARLRLSVRSVRRLTSSGALPIIRVSPRAVRIPADALERYLETGWQSGRSTVVGSSSSRRKAGEYLLGGLYGDKGRRDASAWIDQGISDIVERGRRQDRKAARRTYRWAGTALLIGVALGLLLPLAYQMVSRG